MTKRPTFIITNGCPRTGDKIACNVTQDAPTFSNNMPSAADRAKEGMAAHHAYRANESAFRNAREAAEAKSTRAPQRWLSHEDLK